jgi:hypothetical protein
MSMPILAWHFLCEDCTPNYGRRRAPLREGDVMCTRGKPVLCKRGLHASLRPLDAVYYAPGPVVCRVKVGGTIIYGEDKLVGTTRRILAMADASTMLHEFACDVAEQAVRQAGVTDERCHAAIACKRRWLRGEATDKELAAAEVVARAAARVAAGAATWAAKEAAWAAAWAARDARAAVRAAARAAARDAARAALNADLEGRLLRLLGMEVTR